MRAPRSLCAALAAALAGCGAVPFDYHSPGEIPQGPGLLSGEEGAFVLKVGKAAPYQLEDFQRWRGAPESSDEYREFQDWREWREWRRRNAR